MASPVDLWRILFPVAQMGEGLPAALGALRQLRPSADSRKASPLATQAYLSFEASATRVLVHLQLLGELGVPPRLRGALWTWPRVFRSVRLSLDESTELAVVFGQLTMLGSTEVVDVAYEAALAIGEACRCFPRSKHDLDDDTAEWNTRLDAARVALRDYVLATRAELLDHDAKAESEHT